MNTVSLRLIPTAGPRRPTTAWLIAGGDASRWLGELERCGMDESEIRLFAIPTSASDLSPGGLFIVGSPKTKPVVPPAGASYGNIGGIYLPVEAQITPAVSAEELAGLNRHDYLVFHPILGPVGFAEGDQLTVADLVAPLPLRPQDWERAQPGLTVQARLRSISIRLPSLEELFAEAASDIGSDPVSLEEKPPGAPEQKPLAKAWEGIQGGMLRGLSRLLGGLPQTAARRTFVNELEDWVNAKLRRPMENLQARREQAIRDLLKQFESSPDEALKHALPLGQLGQPRGEAPASPWLGSDSPDFNLKLLGGGRPVDRWSLPPQMETQLRAQYQKMVERERQLGRYRRAAYIYAKLLGDLTGAALMLREGGFFQEAGILYRDHLKAALLAADCFAEGGLIKEAEEIYREQKAWEKIAQLYERVGEEEKAREVYRSWVEQLREKNDFLQAADILRDHLQARDEACELLKSAWPHHAQALHCAHRYLEWRGQSGEHAEARRFLRTGQTLNYDGRTELLWLDLLVQVRDGYPDRPVQNLAEDLGRLKIAGKFQSLREPGDWQKYVIRLVRLAPEDHLLRRDAHRRLDQARAKAAASPVKRAAAARVRETPVEMVREFQFPQKGVNWKQATAAGDHFYALAMGGLQDSGTDVCLARSTFEGAQQALQWSLLPGNQTLPPVFVCWSEKKNFDRVFLFQPGTAICAGKVMPMADGFPWPARLQDSPVAIREVYAPAYSPAGTLWLCRGTNTGMHLSTFGGGTTLVSDIAFDLPPPEWPHLPCLWVGESHVALSINQMLHTYDISGGLRKEKGMIQEFEQPIVGLIAGSRWTRPHFAVVMPNQVALTWFTGVQAHSYVVDAGFDNPKVAITKDGILVVLTASGGHLFHCDGQGVKASSNFSFAGDEPVAVIPGPEARTFATMDALGKIKIYRCSGAWFRS